MKRRVLGGVVILFMLAACSSGQTTTTPGPTTTVVGPTMTVAGPAVTVTATKTVAAPRSSPTVAAECLTADQARVIVSRNRGGEITIESHHGFACAAGWAYVNFTGPNNPNATTVDLQYVNGQWIVGNRLTACGNGTTAPAMVPALVQGGCGN